MIPVMPIAPTVVITLRLFAAWVVIVIHALDLAVLVPVSGLAPIAGHRKVEVTVHPVRQLLAAWMLVDDEAQPDLLDVSEEEVLQLALRGAAFVTVLAVMIFARGFTPFVLVTASGAFAAWVWPAVALVRKQNSGDVHF